MLWYNFKLSISFSAETQYYSIGISLDVKIFVYFRHQCFKLYCNCITPDLYTIVHDACAKTCCNYDPFHPVFVFRIITLCWSTDSSIGIATGSGLDGRGLIPGRDFFHLYGVHTGSEAHPASNPMGTQGDFSWGKAARA
jgi:hypothetical protein